MRTRTALITIYTLLVTLALAAPAMAEKGGEGTYGKTNDKVITNFGNHDVAFAVTVQGDGKILVAGNGVSVRGDYDFALVRYNTDGSLDTGFGIGGRVMTPISFTNDRANAVATQATAPRCDSKTSRACSVAAHCPDPARPGFAESPSRTSRWA